MRASVTRVRGLIGAVLTAIAVVSGAAKAVGPRAPCEVAQRRAETAEYTRCTDDVVRTAKDVFAMRATGGAAGLSTASILVLSQNALPFYNVADFVTAADISAGVLDLSGPLNRIFANTFGTSPYFAVTGGWVIVPDIQHMNAHLADRGLGAVTSYAWGEVNVNWSWAADGAHNGAHVRVTGPGAAGVIQLSEPTGTTTQKWLISPFHGSAMVENLVFMGDNQAGHGPAPGPNVDCTNVLQISGSFQFWLEDVEFYGVGCSTAVLSLTGNTGPNTARRIQFSQCGNGASTQSQAIGVMSMQGGEFGTTIEVCFLGRQLPGLTPSPKNFGGTPALFLDSEEVAGTNTGAGVTIRNSTFGDTNSAGICCMPVQASSLMGHLTVSHCYFLSNTANGFGYGALCVRDTLGLLVEDSTFRLNGPTANNPAIGLLGNISSTQLRNVEIDLGFAVANSNTSNQGGVVQNGPIRYEDCYTDTPNGPLVFRFSGNVSSAATVNIVATTPRQLTARIKGSVQTTDAARVATLVQVPVPAGMSAMWLGRVVVSAVTAPAGGAIGDTFIDGGVVRGGKNVTGTITTYSAGGTTAGDASLNGLAVTLQAAAPNINVRVNQGAAPGNTNNWATDIEVIYSAAA